MPRLFYLFLLLPSLLLAKRTNLYISLNEFLTNERENYVEINFGIGSASLDYQKINKSFSGGLEVTLVVYREEEIMQADRFRILSPNYSDTANLTDLLYHQKRFLLPKGKYRLVMDIQDINDTAETYHVDRVLQLTITKEFPDHSQVIYLEDFKPAKEDGIAAYKRSGYEMFPLISTGTPFFPPAIDRLAFYNELYNLDKKLGLDAKFLVKYYLKDETTGQVLTEYGGFQRASAAVVNPVLGQIGISKLPTGNYLLVVEALDAKGEVVLKHENFFYRKNDAGEILVGNFEDQMVLGTWVDQLGNLDSIVKFVDYLYPISSEREQIIQDNLLAAADEEQLKKYFYAFWYSRKPLAAQESWREYHKQVRIANKLFSSGLTKGYRSDRGRVWLTYGEPSQVERRDMEPNMPPYIIWQYDNIVTPYTIPQNNRLFIFGEFEPSTQIFKLIHSTAIGEINSPNWQQELYFRAYGGPGSIDSDYDPNQREFGTRANQNIILGTTGADTRNR